MVCEPIDAAFAQHSDLTGTVFVADDRVCIRSKKDISTGMTGFVHVRPRDLRRARDMDRVGTLNAVAAPAAVPEEVVETRMIEDVRGFDVTGLKWRKGGCVGERQSGIRIEGHDKDRLMLAGKV